MNEKIKPSTQNQTQQQKTEEKVPWWFQLEVLDLIKPITLKRVHILTTGFFLLVVAAAGYYVWENYLRQPTGAELVEEMIGAAGGMQTWNSIKDGQFTRTHNLYNEGGELLQTKKETFYFKKTDEGMKLQVKSVNDKGEVVWIGKDQTGHWASLDKKAVDPRETARRLGMMCSSKYCEPLCASSMAMYRFAMPFKLADYGVKPDLSLTEFRILDFNPIEFLNLEPLILDITFIPTVGRDSWRFFVDPNDKLIHKIEYYNKSDIGDTRPESVYWSDHYEEFGLVFSHRWTRYWANGQVMDEYIFSDVDFETVMEEDFFERPEGLEWLSEN